MLSLRDPGPELRGKADSLYLAAFPEHERIPLEVLHRAHDRGGLRYRCIMDDDGFVGICCTIETSDILYVVYLAVDGSRRSGGYGTRTLSLLKSSGRRIFLNIEPAVPGCENYGKRVRRRGFYMRNGFSEHGLLDAPDGNTYMVMTANGDVSDSEIMAIYGGSFLSDGKQ